MTRFGKGVAILAAVIILAVAVVPAESQELRGTIDGVVRDNSGAVLPGVTVTATSPALIQPQVVVAGAQGNYRVPNLPPGVYTVTFELPGFQTLIREELRVNLNMTLTVNAELNIAGVEETITITGESPVVDVKSTTTGVNFTEELLEDIPNARDIWAAMAQAPGFQMTGYDVGGSHTGTQTGFQTYGFNDQNRTLLEGINVTEGTNANAGYFDYGSFEEFQLGGAGNMGETHGLGAFFNLTVKSGGDEFHGDLYFDYEGESTISDNVPPELAEPGGKLGDFSAPSSGLSRGNPIQEQTDFNVGGGGPIWKEHAWFYAGYRKNNQFKYTLGYDQDPAQTQLINKTVKGSFALNSRNQIIAFWNKRTKLQAARNLSLTTPFETSWYQESNNVPWKLEWTSVLSDRAFLDVQYSAWLNQFPLYPQATKGPSTEGVPIGRTDRSTSQQAGGQSYYQDQKRLKPQFTGSLSYYQDNWKGTHNFKFGTEIYFESREIWNGVAENIYYWDRAGQAEEVDIYNTDVISTNNTDLISFYGQDSWTINNQLTINWGLRFDRYVLGWPEQDYSPVQDDFFTPATVNAETVVTFANLAPRLGFAYDLTGEGKTVVKGFWGRFYFNPGADDLQRTENPVGLAWQRYRWTDLNGNMLLDPGPEGNLSSSPELDEFLANYGGAGFVTADRDMTNAWGQELSGHVEHEIAESLSVRGSYVYKLTRNRWNEVDLARANEYTIPFEYNDVGADNTPGTGDDQVIQLFNRPADVGTERVKTNPQNAGLPEYKQDYHTIEVALNRRFRNNWMFLTSFQHTWANDFRATNASTNARTAAANGTSYYWQPNRRRFGQQDSSWWNWKMVGRYIFKYDIGVSASYKLQSGYNTIREISVRLPNAGSEAIQSELVKNERAPNVGIFDVRIEKTFVIHPRWARVTGMLDLFNLFNSDVITNYRTRSGSRYKEVIALLDPRIVRFGVRFEF